jgi:RNA polymerase sigma factor (TIGR02999 family)
MPSPRDVTQLLAAWSAGDRQALDRLMPLVHAELRRLARSHVRRERRPNHTLQTTALVNEAFVRLVEQKRVRWQSRSHFFGIAATVMRRMLIDHARRTAADKRGAGAAHVPLDELRIAAPTQDVDLLALDQALERLVEMDPRLGQLVELRFFVGLSIDETARVMRISAATVSREWQTARLWLRRELTVGAVHDA